MAEAAAMMGVANSEGGMDAADEPPKPTWEQVVAMQRESAALRAQVAAVLPELPLGPPPRPRRPPPRYEYPVFAPRYKDPLYPGTSHMQDLGISGRMNSFRGRLEDHRHTSNPEEEIVPAEPSSSMSNVQAAAQRNGLSPITPKNGPNPNTSQMNGVTPKSAISGKSHRDPAFSPSSVISGKGHSQEILVRKRVNTTPRRSSIRAEIAAAELATDAVSRGKGTDTDTANSKQATSWKGCTGSLSMVAPFAGDAVSTTGSGMDSPHVMRRPQAQQSADRPGAPQPGGLFGFLPWGKKVSSVGHAAAPDIRSVNPDNESNKTLELLIRNLQHKLDQTQMKRASEVRELQTALKTMEDKFKQLQSHCQDLELQISRHVKSAGRSSQEDEEEGSSSGESRDARAGLRTSLLHPDITPAAFVRTFDEAVLSMKKLSRAICHHIRDMGGSASQVITDLLGNHKVGKARMPKAVKNLYFESFLNQVMFESFENVNFEANGATPVLDPEALRHASFQDFQALKRVTWSDIERTLDEQGVIVGPSFHQFFVVRMEIVLHQLGDVGETNMPGSVISAFFDAIKAVWLLHHLAFSFRPTATIFRVAQGTRFDTRYMEQVVLSDKEPRGTSLALMVNPGFFLNNCIVRCKVFCSNKYS